MDKTGQILSIIMSEGVPPLDCQRNADQVVRTQHGKLQVWTVINGGSLPLKSVHSIINNYIQKPQNWKPVDLRPLSIDPMAFPSYRQRNGRR